MKWMLNPSSSVLNCGSALSRSATRPKSYSVDQQRARACAAANCTPCEIGDEFLGRPTGRSDATTKVVDRLLVEVHRERLDGCVADDRDGIDRRQCPCPPLAPSSDPSDRISGHAEPGYVHLFQGCSLSSHPPRAWTRTGKSASSSADRIARSKPLVEDTQSSATPCSPATARPRESAPGR